MWRLAEKDAGSLSKKDVTERRVNPGSDLKDIPTKAPPSLVPGLLFVYILVCNDGSLYVGSSSDLGNRLKEHESVRGAKFTRDHPGQRLVYFEGPLPEIAAVRRERQLKRWTRAKKLALIRNQYALLRELSRSRKHHLLTAPSQSSVTPDQRWER
jgi:predicted GIY-YIG superfamily endonuclease